MWAGVGVLVRADWVKISDTQHHEANLWFHTMTQSCTAYVNVDKLRCCLRLPVSIKAWISWVFFFFFSIFQPEMCLHFFFFFLNTWLFFLKWSHVFKRTAGSMLETLPRSIVKRRTMMSTFLVWLIKPGVEYHHNINLALDKEQEHQQSPRSQFWSRSFTFTF